ncbi:hypothetical protein B0J13DRAFT_230 [Dactylonectria estremocensis]|uniref:Uncharacterized protein n=1 Tax=Dactylonectria estremocensis TaxID=1079267 RepID=A0A9P9FFR3_9HYPO|nr:hypothetical protein B0J13DRAFT_230 [Dactylonectria estremocensis]
MNLSPVWNKFGKDDGDTTAMDLLTWGLGAASSASSASAGTSAIFDGLTTVASLAQILGPTDEDDDSIVAENALAMLYDSTQRGLDALVSIVARGYYNTSHVTDGVTLTTSNLPNLEEGTYDTSLGMFFQAGRWLLNSDRITDNMDLWAENFTLRIRQVIVTALLRSHNWFVYFDSTILTEADCSRDGDGNDGRRWVDGYCGDLWIFSYDEDEAIGDLIDTQSNPAVTQSNEKFKAMQDTDDQSYGLASYGGVDLEDV